MAHPLRFQLRRTKGWRKPAGGVVVSRPSKWGNPFVVINGNHGNAVGLFRAWLKNVPAGRGVADAARRELRGKRLGCWCPLGRACHADVLCEIANAEGK
ncbi:MAG TPA: DUF4326 domain-containing protein [Phycisphaerae bacterium]|nr:DUF4326 domain-containing protein [Phycisphaerae bacterium]HVV72432.1 DUF4326 domain-containing protein [Verrucomicrobiae bacterium]